MQAYALAGAILLAVSAAFAPATANAALLTPPPATLHVVNTNGNAGNWYSGAIPPGGGLNEPVLVFIQGLHSNATQWFDDGMYQYAYSSGYRTAFVQLADSDGTGGSLQTNGAILAQQLQEITTYYGVPEVDIVAHSKGGDDTLAAIVYDGASQYVNEIFELSTPNYGSQLADLAYSWWGGWLADLLGDRDAAVYDLQTAYMQNFRNQYDNVLGSLPIEYYTSAGTNHGPWFSALWYGGLYLDAYGPNDGAVTVASAHLPDWYSYHAWTNNPIDSSITYSHDTIHQASLTWQFIEPYLAPVYAASLLASSGPPQRPHGQPPAQVPAGPQTWTAPATLLRGGQFGGSAGTQQATFNVDPTTTSLTIAVLTGHPSASVQLYSPNGLEIAPQSSGQNSGGVFSGAYGFAFVVAHPQPGAYRLVLSDQVNDAYLAMGSMLGAVEPQITAQTTAVAPGGTFSVTVRVPGLAHAAGSLARVRVTSGAQYPPQAVLDENVAGTGSGDTWEFTFQAPSQPGVYNVAIALPLSSAGQPAERDLSFSFSVGGN